MAAIRVVLVDDHHLVREGVRLVLDMTEGMTVVGEAEGYRDALEVLDRAAADIVLLDLSLGDTVGFDAVRDVRARHPGLGVIVLTMHRDPETVRQALHAGADGYMVKGAHARELVDAIRAVARGERYLHSSVTAAVIDASLRSAPDSGLTMREREILRLLAAGMSAPRIGDQLGISAHTVHRHVANISAKLGTRGVASLVRYAVEQGITAEGAA
ncbi:MAG: response regulator transcription factor [Chloroflexota bacterium]